ncbi:glycosyltransferase [Bacteroidota bacterium]
MKILLVITKAEIGGAQVFVLNLARSLQKLGYDVEVAAGSGDYLPIELSKEAIPFHYLKSLKRDVSITGTFFFIFDIWRLFKKNNYDVVHLNSSNTLISAICARFVKISPKIIFTFHGLSLLDKNYEINIVAKFCTKMYFKLLLKFVDYSVFVSNLNYKESLSENLINSGEVILNGLDASKLDFIDNVEARKYFSQKAGIDLTNSFLVGSTGRLAYQKNYEFLIDNFTKIKKVIPTIKFLIIGDGPNRKYYTEKIKKYNIKNDFILIGAIKDSYKYIKAFDLFTLPSRYEGLSISLIEAVFAEIPVLASEVGGNQEILGVNSEQMFILNDINDYIYKLKLINSDIEKYCMMNAKIKEKFALDKMVADYKEIYLKCIADE